ncbi:MAG: GerW family sporulation protein [Lachnospiraceae bacterium]|mgnify:CR=1 FL=1|nr:GerW family sporulation protein [Lachnospiraceae bacterium]
MADNNFSGVIDSLMKGMNTVLSTKTVVGEATKIGDTIILPLVDVSFGVGAGASAGDKKNGGGGGFSGKLTPSAVLVIKNGSTKLVNIKNQDTMTKVLDLIPDLVDKFTTSKEDMIKDEDAVDIAFPTEKNEDMQ